MKLSFNNIILGNQKSDDNYDAKDEDKKNCGVERYGMFVNMINLNKFSEDNKIFIDDNPYDNNDLNNIIGLNSYYDSYVVWIDYFIIRISEE